MPFRKRHYHPGHLQFITTSTYRRGKLFASDRLRGDFVEVLRRLRQETGFRLIGWVLMPEHFHLLIKCEPADSISSILQELKRQTAFRVLKGLQENGQYPWCRQMLARLTLPADRPRRIKLSCLAKAILSLQRSQRTKTLEKLNYMHGNPVKRGLVSSPDQWPWSSFRFYYLNDSSILSMDRCI